MKLTALLLALFSLLHAAEDPKEHEEPMAERVDRKSFDFTALEKMMAKEHDQIAQDMPDPIRKEIRSCRSADLLHELSRETQEWLHRNLVQPRNLQIGRRLEKLEELRCGDDLFQLLSETFWCRLNQQPLEVEKRVQAIGQYWAEQDARRERLHPENDQAQQDGTEQPATRSQSKSEGSDKPKPEAEGRSR